jgi:hypothetical protein
LSVVVSRLRSRLSLAAAALAALAALALLLVNSAPAPADQNPSNLLCKGHIAKGAPDPDDPGSGVVDYTFACSQAITGYSLVLNREATAMETEVFATDATTKEVVPTDGFSCNGDIPGFGINCTGVYGGKWSVIAGRYDIDGNVCTEPRPHPMLVVTYAAKNSKGGIDQYIAGPFDLGRPRASCPKGRKADSGKKRAAKKRSAKKSAVRG